MSLATLQGELEEVYSRRDDEEEGGGPRDGSRGGHGLREGSGEEQSVHHSRDGEGKRDYDEEEAKQWRPAVYSQG